MRTPFHLFRLTGLLAVGLTMVAASACSSVVSSNDGGGGTDVIVQNDGGSDVAISDTTVLRDVVAVQDQGAPDRGMVTPDVPIAVDVVFVDTGPRMLACGASTCTPDQVCCAMTGGGGGVAFMCATSCSDASVTIACESPSNCGGDPCCAQATMGAAGFGISSVACGTSGTACPPALDFATRSAVTRLCTADSDCTSGAPASQLPTCCSVNTGSGTVHACLSTLIASVARGQVTCP